MTTNVSLVRSFTGIPQLAVAGQFAIGARFMGISPNHEGELVAIIQIPTDKLTFEEQSNVVRFDQERRNAA